MGAPSILVLFNGRYPHGMAMTNRLHLYAKGLQQEGFKVKIVSTRHTEKNVSKENLYEGISYEYLKMNIYGNNPISNSINVFFDMIKLYKYLFKHIGNFDVCWPIGYSSVTFLILVIIAKLKKAKVIFEENEYPYITISGRLNNKYFNQISRFILFKMVYKFVDGFVVISEELKQLVESKKRARAQIIKVPVLVSFDDRINHPLQNRNESNMILHAGTISEDKDGLFAVFKSFGKYCTNYSKGMKFLLTNKYALPSVLNPIQTIINEYSIAANVEFKNHLKNDELRLLLETCTMAIINKPYTFQNHYNFSTKLGEYFSYGIPIITTSFGEAERYLKQDYNCLIVKANDISGITNAIKQLKENPDLAERIGKNAILTAKENFDYRIHSQRLAQFIKDVLSNGKRKYL